MWKRRALIFTALIVLYFSSRLVNLTLIPIFTDEAIYIRWGQIALQDPVHRFISLEDGKQPMFVWLMLPALKLIADPLMAGRLVSVFSGGLTLLGLIALSWKLFGEKIGWLSGFIYIISPFFLLYDRLALYDSLTTSLMVWALFLTILMAEFLRFDTALLLGMAVGAGFLTKSSAQFALILLPSTLLLFDWKAKERGRRLSKLVCLGTVVTFLSKGIELILRLAPLSHMIGLKDHTFIVTNQEFIAHPFERLLGNLGGLWSWIQSYMTYPLLGLLMIGLIYGLKKYRAKTIFLSLWFLIPFLALASFGKVLYPRYLLFMLAPLLPLMSLGINLLISKVSIFFGRTLNFWLTKNSAGTPEPRIRALATCPTSHGRSPGGRAHGRRPWEQVSVMLGIFIYPIYFSYTIIFTPLSAPLPPVDRFQLLDDWPSGYGINEVVDFINQRSKTEKIFVGTEGTFGLTPAALNIYLKDNKNVEIKGYWPVDTSIQELTEIANTGKPTFLLLKDTQVPKPEWPVKIAGKWRKGKSEIFSILLEFISK